MYPIENTPYVLRIAKQNEYGSAHQHQFDVSDWLAEYPGASIGIAVIRPGETEDDAMPATTVIVGTTMTWTVSAWETEIPGHSTAEARMLAQDDLGNDVLVKSATIRTFVVPSIADGLPTDPMMPFINQVITYAGIANSNSTLATDEADRANAERLLAEEEGRLAGVARTNAQGFAVDAATAQGLAEDARDAASAYSSYAEENATIARDSAIGAVAAKDLSQQYRDSALGYANVALGAKDDAEDAQGLAETAQGLAEAARDLTQGYSELFVQAESAREAAEGIRLSNESARGSAEVLRISAESARVIAEAARKNAQIDSVSASGNDLVFTRVNNDVLAIIDGLKPINDATALANEKAGIADSAASLANEKASLANTNAGLASDATTAANTAAQVASELFHAGSDAPISENSKFWLDTDEPDLLLDFEQRIAALEALHS